MGKLKRNHFIFIALVFVMFGNAAIAQNFDEYKFNGSFQPEGNAVKTDFQFNGYTNYWHNTFKEWIRYGNLFKMAVPKVDYVIAQSKMDIAEDLKTPGLSLQEGFMNSIIGEKYELLDQPSAQQLSDVLGKGNVLVMTDPDSELGKKLLVKLPKENEWKAKLKSHQLGAKDFAEVNAFYLENGKQKIFVISSKKAELRNKINGLINSTKDLLVKYDLKRGWFGAETLLKSVTCTPGHPLEVIGKGMNEGNSWFTFSGYMDFLAKSELDEWLAKVKLPIIADVGFGSIYGCKN